MGGAIYPTWTQEPDSRITIMPPSLTGYAREQVTYSLSASVSSSVKWNTNSTILKGLL